MGNIVTIDEQVFSDIANAIRSKNKTSETYKPREMAAAIGDNPILIQKTIAVNGTYNASNDNADGYSSVTVNVSAPEVTIADGGSVSQELQPGTIYHFTATTLTSLTITLANNSSDAQYHFDFISPTTAPTLNLPSSVSMANHFTVEPNSKFEIDICNNLGVFAEWVY